MNSLASEYYSLVWRAVREGPCSVDEFLRSLGTTCERLSGACAASAGAKSFYELDLADRFSCIADAMAGALISQLFLALIDVKADECPDVVEFSAMLETLVTMLLRDLAEEAALYRKPRSWLTVKAVPLNLLKECALTLRGGCGAERFKPTQA